MKEFHLKPKQEKKIVKAIREAERNTSGEIRVHISSQSSENHLDKAVAVFQELKMTETKDRNGVLFHVSIPDHNFSIIGDIGIDEKTSDDFWDEIKNSVLKNFKKEKFTKGLVKGIQRAGEALKAHFPYQDDDVNELPNEISRD